jgi:hypothetical protein
MFVSVGSHPACAQVSLAANRSRTISEPYACTYVVDAVMTHCCSKDPAIEQFRPLLQAAALMEIPSASGKTCSAGLVLIFHHFLLEQRRHPPNTVFPAKGVYSAQQPVRPAAAAAAAAALPVRQGLGDPRAGMQTWPWDVSLVADGAEGRSPAQRAALPAFPAFGEPPKAERLEAFTSSSSAGAASAATWLTPGSPGFLGTVRIGDLPPKSSESVSSEGDPLLMRRVLHDIALVQRSSRSLDNQGQPNVHPNARSGVGPRGASAGFTRTVSAPLDALTGGYPAGPQAHNMLARCGAPSPVSTGHYPPIARLHRRSSSKPGVDVPPEGVAAALEQFLSHRDATALLASLLKLANIPFRCVSDKCVYVRIW